MRRAFVAAMGVGWLGVAAAGRRDREPVIEVLPPVVVPEPEPALPPEPEPPRLPTLDVLFDGHLPLDVGAVPDGLASASAQGCAACHYRAVESWATSAHARASTSPAWAAGAAAVGGVDCLGCHRPLVQQHAYTLVPDPGAGGQPIRRDYGGFDATLLSEGVSCAACHVRDGQVVVTRDDVGDAPHRMVRSDALAGSEGCAACHQLTWPGATSPLYDTYGEWSRSPYAAAGIGCVDCHFRDAADGGGSHAMPSRSGLGLSVHVRVGASALVRGGDPLPVAIVLQNSGGGHALPTGSPFESWIVEAWLEGPPRRAGQQPVKIGLKSEVLGRVLSDAPPFATTADTRLAPQEERRIDWTPALSVDDAAGPWSIVVTVTEQIRGQRAAQPSRAWRTPIEVR